MRTHNPYPNQGPIFYITTVVHHRLPLFTQPAYIIALFDSLNYYRSRYHFRLHGFVCMPDHLHLLLWPQQPEDVDGIMRDFKGFTAKRIVHQVQAEEDAALLAEFCCGATRSEHQVWQASFWEQDVFSQRYMREKLIYLHRNSVRAGLVQMPEEYPYSSYRTYLTGEQVLIEIDRNW